jgi:hypothetical protein
MINSAFTKMYSVVKRIDAIELTGGQTADELWRCALAVYNEGSSMMSPLYDISNNPKYKVVPEFPFRTSYDHLAKRTTIFDCGGTNELRLDKADDDVINYDVTEATIAVEGNAQSGMQNQDQDAKGGENIFPELSQNIQGHVHMDSKLPQSDD